MKLQYLLFLFILLVNISIAAAETNPFDPYQKSWEMDIAFTSIDIAPVGEFIVFKEDDISGYGDKIRVVDIKTGRTLNKIDNIETSGKYRFTTNQIFTNGEFIVITGKTNVMVVKVFDKNLNPLWEYLDKDETNNGPDRGVISLDGKNILFTHSFRTPDKTLKTLIYFFENKELKWTKEIEDYVFDISISEHGDLISLKREESGVFVLDKEGIDLKKLGRPLYKIELSADSKYAVGLMVNGNLKDNKVLYFEIGKPENIWKFEYDGDAKSIDQTYDSNITVVSFRNFFYVLNNHGEMVQKCDVDGFIDKIWISSDGKYIIVSKNKRIEVYSNDIPLIRFPTDNAIIEGEKPIFQWDDIGAKSYIVEIDNREFKVDKNEFIFNESLTQGEHTWSVKSVYEIGEGMKVYPKKFYYYLNPIPHLVYPEDKTGFQKGNITLEWEYNSNASKYIVDISGIIYETKEKKFTISAESFHSGVYFWSVKAVTPDDKAGERSKTRAFTVAAPEENVTKKEFEVTSQINIFYALAGILMISSIMAIFIRPYYKRKKLKQEMKKTPTDWCPHCMKFTAGATNCPHCGKNTLTEKNYSKSVKGK